MWLRIGKLALAAVVLIAVAAALVPGIRERGALAAHKLLGNSQLSWREVAVRMVPWSWQGAARASLGLSELHGQEMSGLRDAQLIQRLDFPVEIADGPKQSHQIFLGRTPNLARLDCHYSVLRGGATPHPPHEHTDEEIIIPILGEVEIVRLDSTQARKREIDRIGSGQMVYHASGQPHTIRAVGSDPSTYLVFRWSGEPRDTDALASAIFDFRDGLRAGLASPEDRSNSPLFDSPTELLGRLHCHLSTAKPGAGSPVHQDLHDAAIVLLSGAIEILGQTVEAPAVALHPAHRLHGLQATGASPAQYLALEFSRHPEAEPAAE